MEDFFDGTEQQNLSVCGILAACEAEVAASNTLQQEAGKTALNFIKQHGADDKSEIVVKPEIDHGSEVKKVEATGDRQEVVAELPEGTKIVMSADDKDQGVLTVVSSQSLTNHVQSNAIRVEGQNLESSHGNIMVSEVTGEIVEGANGSGLLTVMEMTQDITSIMMVEDEMEDGCLQISVEGDRSGDTSDSIHGLEFSCQSDGEIYSESEEEELSSDCGCLDNISGEGEMFEEESEWREMKSGSEEMISKRKRGRPIKNQPNSEATEHSRMSRRNKKPKLGVHELIALGCCTMLCLSVVSESSILMVKEDMARYSRTEKSQWVLNWLWAHNRWDEETASYTFFFSVSEWSVCLSAWLSVIGMPLSTYYSIKNRFLNGEKTITVQGDKTGRTGLSTQNSLVWLRNFITKYAQMQPDKCELHLPPCLTKQGIYENMKEELLQTNDPVVSEKYFYRLWKRELPHVKIPKNSRLSKCSFCTRIKLHLHDTKEKKSRLVLINMRNEHLKKQNLERQKYYKHIQKAKNHPDKYLSIIIDGMDQSKTELPHYMYISSLISCLWKLRVHLAGAIVHGVGIYGFFDYMQYQHGSYLTIHVLLNILWMLKEKLPSVLYLQMDNCGRENKNRFLFGFLGLLIELNIFKKIKVSFLPVGHTHEDIDQVFSRFSHWLRDHSALSLPSLISGFEKCTTPPPIGIVTDNVFNVTDWIASHIAPMSCHSKPHAFKIVPDVHGKAVLYTKAYANDKMWDRTEGDECYILTSRPTGKPDIITPNFSKIDVAKLESDVEKAFKYFKSENDIKWWKDFFLFVNNQEVEEDVTFKLEEIVEANRATNTDNSTDEPTESEEISSEFDFLKEQETYTPVILGKKTNKSKPADYVTQDDAVSIDDMAILDVPKYAGEWPQIGKIIEVNNGSETVKVHWFKGSKSSQWAPCAIPVKGCKGKREAWTDIVPKHTIKLSGFKLTMSNYLPKNVKDFIDTYEFC